MTDDDSEPRIAEMLERTLAGRAADAPRAFDLASRARTTHRRQQVRRGVGAVVLAAAVAGVSVPVLLRGGTPDGTAPVVAGEPAPTGYRWESTRGVEFLVPADWTYGTSGEVPCAGDPAPTPRSGVVGLSRAAVAGVGCTEYLPATEQAPHVWIDSPPAEARTTDYGNGLVEEGREVGGLIVSVLSDDDELRARVLDSLHVVDGDDAYGCPQSDPVATQADLRPPDTGGLPPASAVTSISLCLYDLPSQLDSSPTERPLVTSSRFDDEAASALVAAIEAAPDGVGPDGDPGDCLDPYGDEVIVLRVNTADDVHIAYLRDSGCIGHGTDDGMKQRMLTTDVFAALWPAELMRPTAWQSSLDPILTPLHR